MAGRSKKSKSKTSEATDSGTSSMASRAGVEPSNLLYGPASFPSPLPVVHALPSRTQAKGKGKKTRGTSGQPSLASSATFSLQSSLASKLVARLDIDGSMEYSLTWQVQIMSSRLRICRLRASGRRTSDKGSGGVLSGYPTPTSQDFGAQDKERLEERRKECKERTGNGNGFGLTLTQMASLGMLSGYPTPQRADGERQSKNLMRGENNLTLAGAADLVGWTSPRASDAGRARQEKALKKAKKKGGSKSLDDDAQQLSGWATPTVVDATGRDYTYPNGDHKRPFLTLPGQAMATAGWATPTSRDHKDGACSEADVETNALLGRQAVRLPPIPTSGTTSSSLNAPTANRGAFRLNANFSLWLQGFPETWSLSSPGWENWETILGLLESYYAKLEPTTKDG